MSVIASGSKTIVDLSDAKDIVQQNSPPANPYEGLLWLDTSVTPPVLKRYTNGEWQLVTDQSIAESAKLTVETTIVPKLTLYDDRISAILGKTVEEWQANGWKAETSLTELKAEQTGFTTRVENVEERIVGGTVNWLTNSTGNLGIEHWTNPDSDTISADEKGHGDAQSIVWPGGRGQHKYNGIYNNTASKYIRELKAEDTLTISCYYQASNIAGDCYVGVYVYDQYSNLMGIAKAVITETTGENWGYATGSLKLSGNPHKTANHPVNICTNVAANQSGYVRVSKIMVQMGRVATEWSPSVLDGQLETEIMDQKIAESKMTAEEISDSVRRVLKDEDLTTQIGSYIRQNGTEIATLVAKEVYGDDGKALEKMSSALTQDDSQFLFDIKKTLDDLGETLNTNFIFDINGLSIVYKDENGRVTFEVKLTPEGMMFYDRTTDSQDPIAYFKNQELHVDHVVTDTSIKIGNLKTVVDNGVVDWVLDD